jgi:iron complex transport system ATP-binding protein
LLPEPAFTARDLTFAYPRALSPAVADVALDVPPGQFFAVLGPNGSGKSTLLKLLLGALSPGAGTVSFAGRPVAHWDRRELARRVGAVSQSEELAFRWTVGELVEMGRYPHLGAWRPVGRNDRDAVAAALARCDVAEFADRPISTLSGGERQRVRIARALAQQPSALVLDEPTAALDVRHEMRIFELLAGLASKDGVTIVTVTHNLNLAARYAHRLLLLDRGRAAAYGAPTEVLRLEVLERVYRWPLAVVQHPGPGPDRGAPQVVPLAVTS